MKAVAATLAIATGSWTVVPGGSWSPSLEQIAEVRSHVEYHVRAEAAARNLKLPDWRQYSFQYQGRSEGRAKVIFVNAFCITPPASAASQFVVVFDGGPCFFNVEYDPEKKKFSPVLFNGRA